MRYSNRMNKPGNYLLIFSWIVFAVFLSYRLLIIVYPQPDAGGVEGNVIYFIQRILDGQALYSNPELPPYAIAQYTPLYYYLVAGTAYLFSIQPDDVLSIYITSRILGLILNLAFMIVAFRIARLVYEIPKDKSLLVSILAFIFLEITSFSRPDSLYHVLFLLAMYFFLDTVKGDKNKTSNSRVIWFGILAALALFAKQSAILLPIVGSAWFIWNREFKDWLIFCVSYGVILFLGLAILFFSGDLQLLYMNVITGISNGISPGWFRNVIMADFYLYFGWIFVIVAGVLILRFRKDTLPLQMGSCYLLVALFILNNLLAIKNGSNPGYFTEWWTLVMILTASNWTWFQQRSRSFTIYMPGLIITVILFIKMAIISSPLIHMAKEYPFARQTRVFNNEMEIAQQLRSDRKSDTPYYIFTNFNTAESYLSNILFREAVMPQMDIVGLASYPQKKYDYSDFVRRLQSGEFSWMIMRMTGPQKRFFENVLDDYILSDNDRGFNIYEFKKITRP